MREFIEIYLLLKSATRQRLTWLDIRLAKALAMQRLPLGDFLDLEAPDWLKLIAQMEQEAPAPEVFGLWWFLIERDIRTWWGRLWGKS